MNANYKELKKAKFIVQKIVITVVFVRERKRKLSKVKLVPTQGAYQKNLIAEIIRETKTLYFVISEDFLGTWKFSKEDGFRTGHYKNEFPKYKIVVEK